jgi:eukaryotic-like serine/threonine-protein kinase
MRSGSFALGEGAMAASAVPPGAFADIDPPALLRARQKLGKYRIERRISDGPTAAVYQALDSIQGVRVALKIPHQSAMNDYFLADFKREARLAPRLEHPNILPIRDASFIDGHFVIAMPLGELSLTDRMRRRLSTDTALSFTEQALAAVAHAHNSSVIHCDIKPDNFIVFPDNQLKLTDFGFSKVAEHTLRASGSGTVGYIAPEQAVGRPMFQSDVFSLGLVIYELFSGYLPEWPYDWPPRGIQSLRRRLKPSLVDWLQRAIQARPEKRYKNAARMYREFKRLRNGSAKKRPASRRRVPVDPALWQKVLFRQFQRKYRKLLETRHECRACGGPVSEAMQACPWCGTKPPLQEFETSYPATCPRCQRGTKLDWRYCAWCYGPGFEVETTRRYPDRRYSAHCGNAKCREPLMPFMRYCPWCRTKVKRPWKLPGTDEACPSCRWGVDRDFWHHCPWCTKALAR